MNRQACDVAIIGAGPVGLTLAHQLARSGVDTLVIERNDELIRLPRAVGIDGESIRTWQAIGLADELLPHVHYLLGGRYFNADGEELFRLNYEGQEPCGYPLKQSFDQGETDRILARRLLELEDARLWFGHELTDFSQCADGVTLKVRNNDGEDFEVQARFLVGCDGGRSTVRRLMNVDMVGEANDFPWLVIDTWDPWFDPGHNSMFFCNPKRPGMTLRVTPEHRRWEWMLLPGEKPEDLLEESRIAELLSPYTDFDRIRIFRKLVYHFSAVIAESWHDRRVLLAGDAAHMTPPFAGQGLNAGIRDTRNLAWKIALVVKGHSDIGLLATYEEERREHTRQLIEFAVRLGEQIQPIDEERARERDEFFKGLSRDAARLEAYVDELSRSQRIRTLEDGAVVPASRHPMNGRYVLQPRVNGTGDRECLLDDLLGPGFSLLGYGCDPEEKLSPATAELVRRLDARPVRIAPGMDAGGVLDALFDHTAGRIALVRPDRFVLAAFDAGDANGDIEAVRDALAIAAAPNRQTRRTAHGQRA